MSKRITITHTDEVSCSDAVTMVKYAIENGIDRGECITFSNGLAVDMTRDTNLNGTSINGGVSGKI